MSKTLKEVAEQLNAPRTVKNKKTTEVEVVTQVPKVQLIYAFNGTGKTRLSREFKQLVAPKGNGDDDEATLPREKIFYYNAFTNSITEDLPREIELRQKQYQYYRDLLLSFPQFPSSGGVPVGRGGEKVSAQ